MINKRKLLGLLASLLVCAPLQAANSIELPVGIAFDPPKQLDLTHQVVPAYDEKEKVIAGWDGEKLLYFVVVEKLPPGYTDAKSYFPELIASIANAQRSKIESGKIIAYPAQGDLKASAMMYTVQSKAGEPGVVSIVHLLTDGKQSFLAIATAIEATSKERLIAEATALMQTARLSAVGAEVQQLLKQLQGSWVHEEKLPDGRLLRAVFELRPDQSFSASLRGGATDFSGSGSWGLTSNTIYWEYLQSSPPLPAARRKDADEILKLGPKGLELKSELSGRTRLFKRLPG